MKKMSKKNLDGQKTYDGLNQSAKNLVLFGALSGQGYANPGMKMTTLRTMIGNMKIEMESLMGTSKPVMILTDSLRLLEALAIKYEDTPIVEVVDMILDEAYENYQEKESDE
tara:strand:- start:170 stop:505 length:336 start_codon:yes stop_codon:yes gene_type:complete